MSDEAKGPVIPAAQSSASQDLEIIASRISEAEAISYLNEKLPSLKCPGCGHELFEVFITKTDDTLAQAQIMLRGNVEYIPAAVISCTNCALLQHVHWPPIMNWVKQKRSAENGKV